MKIFLEIGLHSTLCHNTDKGQYTNCWSIVLPFKGPLFHLKDPPLDPWQGQQLWIEDLWNISENRWKLGENRGDRVGVLYKWWGDKNWFELNWVMNAILNWRWRIRIRQQNLHPLHHHQAMSYQWQTMWSRETYQIQHSAHSELSHYGEWRQSFTKIHKMSPTWTTTQFPDDEEQKQQGKLIIRDYDLYCTCILILKIISTLNQKKNVEL